jgi:alpha-1,2-mannosyltransferase
VASVAAVVVAAVVVGALVGELPDLHVYRYAGRSVLEQWPAYGSDDPVTGYPLTYPPFAAVLMVPVALVSGWVAAGLWTGLSAACLVAAVVVTRRDLGQPAPWWLVPAAALGSLALEPVWQNYAFGQVNTILMAAVLVDVLRPERRWSGVLLGVAAGVKLTPLVFVVLLVMVGQRGAAARATATFGATVLLGLVAFPGATSYWTDGLLDPGRVGPPALAHNQSLTGALTRILGAPPAAVVWLAVVIPLTVAVLLIARTWWQRGDRALAVCLTALAMLLASPVSWSHHWVWAVPVALVLWERSKVGAVLWTAVFIARPMLWPPWAEGREYDWRWWEHTYGNAFVLSALAVVAAAATWPVLTPVGTPSSRGRRSSSS